MTSDLDKVNKQDANKTDATTEVTPSASSETTSAAPTLDEPTPGNPASPAPAAPTTPTAATGSRSRLVTRVAVVVAVVATVLAVIAGFAWHSASSTLDSNRAADADRQTAVDTARAYTERSLTYDHTDLDAFFSGVEEGTSDGLKERFEGVKDVLSQIMTESQVVASGKVNAATVTAQDGNSYTVSVFATQTTQNLQQPQPGAVPTLLTVTVEHDGDQWLVADYGADTGQ